MKIKKDIFDDYVHSYELITQKNLFFFNKKRKYFDQYKIDIIKKKISTPGKILDFGSGIGLATSLFIRNFRKSKIFAFDTSKKSLEFLKRKNPKININKINVFKNKYDLITVFGVFHHIPVKKRIKNLKLLFSLLKSSGKIFIFEHNPYNPITRNIVNNCPYDIGVKLIAMKNFIKISRQNNFKIIDKGYCLFFPEFLKFFRKYEYFLKWLPLGGQYYIELSKKDF